MGTAQGAALTRPGPHPPRAARLAPRPARPRVPCPLPRLQTLLLFLRGWPCSPQRCRRAEPQGPRPQGPGPGPRRRRRAPPRGPRRSRCSSSGRWERRRTEPLPLPFTLRTHQGDVTRLALPHSSRCNLSLPGASHLQVPEYRARSHRLKGGDQILENRAGRGRSTSSPAVLGASWETLECRGLSWSWDLHSA